MRKILLGMMVALLLVLAVGCAPKKEAAPAPVPVPEPTPVVEVTPPIEEAKEVTQKTVVGALLARTGEDIKLVSDLKCDVIEKDGVQEGRFEFTLHNPTTETIWTLSRVRAMDSSEKNPLVITVNGRRFEHTDCDGEMGTEELAPGESVTCARGFDPKTAGSSTTDWVIRVGVDDLGKPLQNKMVLKGIEASAELTFKCD